MVNSIPSNLLENQGNATSRILNAKTILAMQEGVLNPQLSDDNQNIRPEDIRAAMIEARINAMAAWTLDKSK
jgi:hypothetical protein